MQHGFMSVDAKLGAGRAFLRSLYQQYADWGVDFGTLWFSLDMVTIFSLYNQLHKVIADGVYHVGHTLHS